MAIHANLNKSKIIVLKYLNLSAVLLNHTHYVYLNTTTYPSGELANVYNGYSTAPLDRGSQISLVDGATLIKYEVESELPGTTADGHIHIKFPRYFFSKLSGDSGTDNVLDIDDTSGANFQVNDWVAIKNDDGDVEVNKITGISSGQLTFLNNFERDWTTAKNSYVSYAVQHHYGGDTGSSQQDMAGTWDANYVGVYHFNEDHAGGATNDSSGNANHLTNSGTISISDMIDKCRDSDGSTDYMYADHHADFNFSTSMAIEATINRDSEDVVDGVCGKTGGIWSDVTWSFYISSNERIYFVTSKDGTTLEVLFGNTNVDTSEHHIGADYDGSTKTVYLDGVDDKNVAWTETLNTNTQDVIVGAYDWTVINSFGGPYDELTISNISRSVDWWLARNQSRLGTGITYSAEETVGVAGRIMSSLANHGGLAGAGGIAGQGGGLAG